MTTGFEQGGFQLLVGGSLLMDLNMRSNIVAYSGSIVAYSRIAAPARTLSPLQGERVVSVVLRENLA
jgi:hypothetical protein